MIFNFRSTTNLTFGPMRTGHFSECAIIHCSAFAAGWTESDLETLNADRSVVSDCASSDADESVQGFIISRVALDEAEILAITIKNKMRKNGIGKELLNFHILNLNSRGVKSIYLEVAENNNPAINLYKRVGFIQIGVRKSYYRGIDDVRIAALTMKLTIP